MRVVILAGGRGSRLAELTNEIPKPMVRVGGEPMLYHIMAIYARFGFEDFIIAGGYKQEVIQAWLDATPLPWQVQLVDTGQDTTTGGRIVKLKKRLSNPFLLTYGDGVADIDIGALLKFHNKHQSMVTVTAVHPPPRFGQLAILGDYVHSFVEKPIESAWINAGFFVVEPEALEYIDPAKSWETACEQMVERHYMTAYKHEGFWKCMDTLRDVEELNEMAKEEAPWIGKISA